MKKEFTYLSRDGVTRIHATAWIPKENPRAILQLCHGMQERIARYHEFAEFLCQNGFYVTGNDHLGHGQSIQNEKEYGYFSPNGNECLIGDLHTLRKKTQDHYPALPYFMLGHSMGSFLIRQYAMLHGNDLSGVIIVGTGSKPDLLLPVGRLLCRGMAAVLGWHYCSKLIDYMACGAFNKQFEPARTSSDWLTKDRQIVDTFLADPLCGHPFTVNAYYHMFRSIQFIQKKENIERLPKDLPLLLISGSCDPVGSNGKGVKQVFRAFQAAGIKDVQMQLYEDDRHEILNETDRDTVYHDLLNWMNSYF